MAKPTTWSDVRKRVVRPEDEPYIKQGREAIRAELRLAELRKHRRASQTDVARRLAVSQSNISQLERAGDPRLSTVADSIGAMGGQLQIIAVFPDERVSLGHDMKIRSARTARTSRKDKRTTPSVPKAGVVKARKIGAGKVVGKRTKATTRPKSR
jgi:DNA-binding XRE family transcriptional regulator